MPEVKEKEVPVQLEEKVTCYHCGDSCNDECIIHDDKPFCCLGCKTVYEILDDNGLCNYYDLENSPGITLKNIISSDKYAYLDNEKINYQLSDFISEHKQIVTFYIPSIHCSSCIWLLENLYKLKDGISQSRVQFSKKQLVLQFDPSILSLRDVVETLASVGYAPQITLESYKKEKVKKEDTSLYLKMGVAGFCFGNIMLLAFPEYIGFDGVDDALKRFFSYFSLTLSLPVVFYAASDYFKSAFKGFNQRYVNIDVPIVLGVVTLFVRSAYEIIANTGSGYLDSLAGLIFFLLLGKWFQSKTYQGLSFDRDYTAYFPLAVNRISKNGAIEAIPVAEVAIGDHIQIKNDELIPVDGVLVSDTANIDFSFVTGESMPTRKEKGDYIYAGGKQKGSSIALRVEKPVSQSYLTQLWNNEAFSKEEDDKDSIINSISKYFTLVVLAIAAISAVVWYFMDPSKIINAFTAVLIVACPCALALSSPFTLGNTMRVFGRLGLYLKNTTVIEQMSRINHLVFDKTGTITYNDQSQVSYEGGRLEPREKQLIASLASQSTHPLSRIVAGYLGSGQTFPVEDYMETPGAGIEGLVEGSSIKIGAEKFVNNTDISANEIKASRVFVSINGVKTGCFLIQNKYRTSLESVASELKQNYALSILSGDNNSENERLVELFGLDTEMHFNQLPDDKLYYVRQLQESGSNIMMLGDGLNDAGALKQSNVGIVVAENVNNFTPASDAIMDAKVFPLIAKILKFSHTARAIVYASFALSFLYNIVGLSFAVSGNLTPVFAAVLMPLSSISVVFFATFMVNLMAKYKLR